MYERLYFLDPLIENTTAKSLEIEGELRLEEREVGAHLRDLTSSGSKVYSSFYGDFDDVSEVRNRGCVRICCMVVRYLTVRTVKKLVQHKVVLSEKEEWSLTARPIFSTKIRDFLSQNYSF